MTNDKNNIDLNTVSRVHFVGVGGIGMSALARYFLHEGKKVRQSLASTALGQDECEHSSRSSFVEVSGSDRSPSALTEALAGAGVSFSDAQRAENITDDIDLVVYTEAMPRDHEELAAARKKSIPCVNYFEALGLVTNPYYLIAVAGTHGKTTTTAMLTDVLEAAGLDPTAFVGSLRTKTKSNFRAGKSKYCIVEACEYRRDFLHLKPEILVITNIEEEHLDYYKDLADIQDAFRALARSVPETGYIVCNQNDLNVAPVLKSVSATIINYKRLVDPLLSLQMPGMHNLLNAAAALGVARVLQIGKHVAKQALEDFTGTWRRSEYLGGTEKGAVVFDDYGHHPTEIEATLKGFRERYPQKRMVVAFQPHLHSRTEDFFDRFVETLALADEVVLAPIFEARKVRKRGAHTPDLARNFRNEVNENARKVYSSCKVRSDHRELRKTLPDSFSSEAKKSIGKVYSSCKEAEHTVSSEMLADAIRKRTGKPAQVFENYEEIAEYLEANTGTDDIVITMGAGAINKVAEMLVRSEYLKLRKTH